MSDEMLKFGKKLLRAGLSIIPMRNKKPAVANWTQYRNRLPSAEELKAWQRRFNQFALVVNDNLFALDFDSRELFKVWRKWFADEEARNKCYIEKTPRGGRHIVFRTSQKIDHLQIGNKSPGVERKHLLNVHPSPGYKVLQDGLTKLEPLSEEEALSLLQPLRRIPIHQRKNTLVSLAGTMRNKGAKREDFENTLPLFNTYCCQVPLSNNEIKDVIESAMKWTPPAKKSKVVIRSYDQIESRKQTWLWKNVIPSGGVTLLAGNPDTGKSCLTLYIAAHVSKGEPWADGESCKRGTVLLLSGEDCPERTIKPRLLALGANMKRIVTIDHITEVEGNVGFETQRDCAALERRLAELEQEERPVSLVILDPVAVFLGSEVDSNSQAGVRQALRELDIITRQRDIALILVSHFNKSMKAPTLYRVSGSLGWTALAREVWFVIQDEVDREKKLLRNAKHNLTKDWYGHNFRLESKDVELEDGNSMNVPVVIMSSKKIEETAADILEGKVKFKWQEAKEFLEEKIEEAKAAGQDCLPVAEIKAEAEKREISEGSLQKAVRKLGLERREERKRAGKWYWHIPKKAVKETLSL